MTKNIPEEIEKVGIRADGMRYKYCKQINRFVIDNGDKWINCYNMSNVNRKERLRCRVH